MNKIQIPIDYAALEMRTSDEVDILGVDQIATILARDAFDLKRSPHIGIFVVETVRGTTIVTHAIGAKRVTESLRRLQHRHTPRVFSFAHPDHFRAAHACYLLAKQATGDMTPLFDLLARYRQIDGTFVVVHDPPPAVPAKSDDDLYAEWTRVRERPPVSWPKPWAAARPQNERVPAPRVRGLR